MSVRSEVTPSPLDITRQSLTKMRVLFRETGMLQSAVIVDTGQIGTAVRSVIRLRGRGAGARDIPRIVKVLGPYYYWIFDDLHVLMTGHGSYGDLVGKMGQVERIRGLGIEDVQVFDMGRGVEECRWGEI